MLVVGVSPDKRDQPNGRNHDRDDPGMDVEHMEEEVKHEAQKLLQEFDAEEGRLDLVALQVTSEENRKIRDEIISLAGGAHVGFLNIEADTIRAIVGKNLMAPEGTCQATEEMIRAFEDAGWRWG